MGVDECTKFAMATPASPPRFFLSKSIPCGVLGVIGGIESISTSIVVVKYSASLTAAASTASNTGESSLSTYSCTRSMWRGEETNRCWIATVSFIGDCSSAGGSSSPFIACVLVIFQSNFVLFFDFSHKRDYSIVVSKLFHALFWHFRTNLVVLLWRFRTEQSTWGKIIILGDTPAGSSVEK